jgi:cysteine-rich repeat protein
MTRLLAVCAVTVTLSACNCGGMRPITEDGGEGGGAATGGGTGGGGATDSGTGGGNTNDGGADCGNGVREGAEACDDGANLPGDGCSGTCGVEQGWFCPFPPPMQPSQCVPSCGDGRLIGNEPCDDGNARNNDGCSNTCQVEPGYTCTGMPSLCVVSCGDGVRGGNELCDDGNRNNADGCSSTCQPEPGYVCAGTPSMCLPLCGDGMMVGTEACDDGFRDGCGSCNANCTGPGAGSSCGDGVRCFETEECDDGINPGPNSMCTSMCTLLRPDGGGGVDAGFDAGVVDAGTVDSGTIDSGTTDAGFDAGTVMDAGTPDAGPPGMGVFAYQKIPNITFTDDLSRVIWHPSGRFALLLGAAGRVIKYDPATKTLSLVQQIASNASLADIDVANDGTYFLIVGVQASVSHLWRIDVGVNDALSPASDLGTFSSGTVSAIAVEPGSTPSRFAIGARSSTFGINYLYVYTSGAPPAPKGYNASGNAIALMWGNASIYAPSAHVLTADGVNGADSKTWLEASNMFVGNNWSLGFGNPGQGHWQPNGTFGGFVGWSSNKLYVFDGAWHLVNLPGNNGISPQQFAFRADGQRGLIVGRPVGTTLKATVIEYRPTSVGAYDDASFLDVGIDNFAATPYFGNSNEYLLDVAWRPGACDEGLIVGMDNGTSTSPTFGLAIRFYDTSQTVCAP